MATVSCSPEGEVDAVADLTVSQKESLITVAWRSGRERRETVIDRSRPEGR
jgi:hypothetical protein